MTAKSHRDGLAARETVHIVIIAFAIRTSIGERDRIFDASVCRGARKRKEERGEDMDEIGRRRIDREEKDIRVLLT